MFPIRHAFDMGKVGAKPQGKVKIKWSPEFAYGIGLMTTDGNLSKDGRHLSFVSNDKEQIDNLKRCFGLSNKIGKHFSGHTRQNKGIHIQFGDVLFYRFLLRVGLMPNKSKALGELVIPKKYFYDFLRGHFDGDGCFYSYWDPRWRSSFMFYTTFLSASSKHIDWLQQELFERLKIKGHITRAKRNSIFCLKYAKGESMKLLPKIYRNRKVLLSRKYLKIRQALGIIGLSL
jgi:hypothetical protein